VERIATGLLDTTLSRFMLGAAIAGARAGEVVSDDALLCCEGFGAGHLASLASSMASANSYAQFAIFLTPGFPQFS